MVKGWKMNFSRNLSRARNAAGLTQRELADAIGVSRKDIARWENGDSSPDVVALASICRTLHISSDVLLETGK